MSHLAGTLFEFGNHNIVGKTILDVGCRNSENKKFFNEKGFQWTGVDKYPEGRDVQAMDMTDLAFPSESFDVVFVCHSLEHCEDPIGAIKEFKRVLTTDGTLFISLPCHCKHHILESDSDHIFCFTDMQITRLLIYCGLDKDFFIVNSYNGYPDPEKYNLIAMVKK